MPMIRCSRHVIFFEFLKVYRLLSMQDLKLIVNANMFVDHIVLVVNPMLVG
jgi:hypothetical protein